jgi:hypothetical protein
MMPGSPAPTEIATRHVPERRLATVRAEVFQPQVGEFLGRAFATLFEFANDRAGLRARDTTPESPTYALYHGTFGFDAPTRVEACVVLDRDVEAHEVDPAGAITVRVEPAHMEAFLPLTRRRLALPALGAAYDELGLWVATNARMLDHIPPREVYIADVMNAGDDDHVCDVTFPFEPRY